MVLATPTSAAPAVADMDMQIPSDDITLSEDEDAAVNLSVEARLKCAVGFDAPGPVAGTLRGFIRGDGGVHEFGRAPLDAAWHDAGDGSYFIQETLHLEIPHDDEAFAPGDNEVVVQFLPDQPREPTRRCQADGYRIDAAEETFVVTVVDADEETRSAALAVSEENRFHLAPMLLALGLVALLALFAFRRQRH